MNVDVAAAKGVSHSPRRPEGNRETLWSRIKKYRLYYVLIIPGILFFLVFHYLPMYGITIAFKDIKGLISLDTIFSSPFVGLDNFTRFTSSYYFWNVLGNTLAISAMRLIFGFPAPILFALLLNELRSNKLKRTVQTISYMPHFISVVVLCALVQIVCTTDGGLLNRIIELFGGQPVYFLGDARYFRWVIVISSIWKEIGWNTIIYLAAITSVDTGLLEAAMLDGAGRLKQVRHVILPSIKPTIVVMLILAVGGIMNAGFEQILLLYSEPVYSVGDIIDTFIYRSGIQQSNYSYSTAIGLFKSLINMVMVLSTNIIAKKLGNEGIW